MAMQRNFTFSICYVCFRITICITYRSKLSFEIVNTEVEVNSAAYIQGWLKALKNDRKFIVVASSYAQKGVEYILNPKNADGSDDPIEWLKRKAPELKSKK